MARIMNIPSTVHVLGFTKNPDAMFQTMKDVERVGFKAEPFWNFPTPYTQFVQKHLAKANNAMRNCPGFFNSGWGHYSILCIARDLGEVPVFVVEDDCRFLIDADLVHSTLANLPADADLALLDSFGPANEQDEFIRQRQKAVGGWARIDAARSAAAYIVGPRVIDRLINLGDRGTRGKKARIFDQWFENRWLEGMNIYCAVPNLAIQQVPQEQFALRPSSASNLEKYKKIGVDFSLYAGCDPSAVSALPNEKDSEHGEVGVRQSPVVLAGKMLPTECAATEQEVSRSSETPQRIDVLYVIGKGAAAQDNQPLRWSLRSLAKYAQNLGRVIVSGCPPAWLSDEVIKVEADTWSRGKHWNMLFGITEGIRQANIRHPFLFSSDDHYLCRPAVFSPETWPRFTRGQLLSLQNYVETKHKVPGSWQRSLCDTYRCFKSEGLSTRDVMSHNFTWMDGSYIEEVLMLADKHRSITKFGFEPLCLFNAIYEKHNPNAVFKKISRADDRKVKTPSDIDAKIASGIWGFSTNPKAETTPAVVAKMNSLFPDKCRFEK